MTCLFHYINRLLLFCLLMEVTIGGDGNGVISKCIKKEREALLHIKSSIEDPGDVLSTWRGKEDNCCNWDRVTCDHQTGHVTEVQLSNYNGFKNITGYSCLAGEISPSLVNLTRLNYLDLSYNLFNGTIPSFIGSLTKIRYLNLGWNSFHGLIPPEIGNLTNLKELHLERPGRCTVENIYWFSRLSNLEGLNMNGISLAKVNHWVNAILGLPNLLSLHLEDCDLSQVMHPYSSSLLNSPSSSNSSITALKLRRNNLNSSMYGWLFPLTSNSLEVLDLSNNMLEGIPRYLGNCCSLNQLHLYGNSAVANFSDFLKNLSSGCTPDSLVSLDVSRSQFTGPLSDEIQKFSFLRDLYISHNQLSAPISNIVWQLPSLYRLDISSNSFGGIVISENSGRSTLMYLDLSSCKLGPNFPKWISTNIFLNYLDIANNRISDTIPVGFWNMWNSSLQYLNLSCNNISGKAPNLSSIFDRANTLIDLSTNNFSGPVLNATSSLAWLNLSRNKFYGGISFLCQIYADQLLFLDLSHNYFTGQLPDCLWHFKNLKVLNLGENNLFGRLPNSLGYLVQLEVLHLQNNKISGELPLSLKNLTRLTFLNLKGNRIFGNVPDWIGENLSKLYILSLGSNNLFGAIPLELCRLASLQILDLSNNHLNGTIPTCLNNFTSMVLKGLSPQKNLHFLSDIETGTYSGFGGTYVDRALIKWQGNEREFTNNLRFLKSIDLSSNNLTGHIPNELTSLHELVALNLSMNALLGEIPQNISEMKELLILDLSRNNFSGRLPSSMSGMTRLDYLDVSYNNLSGRIPFSTQLQSFDPSRYTGNSGLCGPPITKYCPGDEPPIPPVIGENEGDVESEDELQRLFCIGAAIGFATGFWITSSGLLLYKRGRNAFFHFLGSLEDWIYVKMMVLISKW